MTGKQSDAPRKPIEVASGSTMAPTMRIRQDARPSDVSAVREIAAATGFFSADEVEVAVELMEDRIAAGETSEYQFIFAEVDGRTIGFASFGRIACTVGSFDLYWIAVHPELARSGIGRRLTEEAERLIAVQGGRRVYLETSSRAQYDPTRRFYERCGYRVDAVQNDFYAPGDGKVTLVKTLQ